MQDKMYRIFISSTYSDLKNERKILIKSVLSMGHYPICMETFVATQGHQMDFIKKQLDTADMYIVILGRRYGSHMGEDKCSYTQHEYEYAKQIGLPVLAFICKDSYNPQDKYKQTEQGNKRVWKQFRKLLCSERHLAFWENESDLISQANTSIQNLINDNTEGWIKETKYQRIKRDEITDKIHQVQTEIYAQKDSDSLPYDHFIASCNRLINIYHELKAIGTTQRDKVQYKKIDSLFFYMQSKTEDYKLNPIIYFRYAQFLHDFYEIEKSRKLANDYLTLCDDELEKANVNKFLGLLFWKTKDFATAESHLNSAINILTNFYNSTEESLSNTIYQNNNSDEMSLKLLSEIYNIYGLCADNKNDLNNAIKYYQLAVNAVELLTKINSEKYLFKYQLYIFNLASIKYKLQNYYDALPLIESVISILEQDSTTIEKNTRLARSYQLRGDILDKLNEPNAYFEYQKSAEKYNEVIMEREEHLQIYIFSYKNEVAWCYHKLSDVYCKLKQYTRAVDALKKAINYRSDLLLSSIGYEHNEYLLNLAESEHTLSYVLFYNSDKERNDDIAIDALKYADSAFFHFEQLFDSNPSIYREQYIQTTKLNIEICIYLNKKHKLQSYVKRLDELKYRPYI